MIDGGCEHHELIKRVYKELLKATNGFKQLLGKGGFGQVFKGTLQGSETKITVKRVSHDSSQGMRDFMAEIATIGRLRHPNLVRLLGYCRYKEELYLVYDFMPNGSLDKYLYAESDQEYMKFTRKILVFVCSIFLCKCVFAFLKRALRKIKEDNLS